MALYRNPAMHLHHTRMTHTLLKIVALSHRYMQLPVTQSN